MKRKWQVISDGISRTTLIQLKRCFQKWHWNDIRSISKYSIQLSQKTSSGDYSDRVPKVTTTHCPILPPPTWKWKFATFKLDFRFAKWHFTPSPPHPKWKVVKTSDLQSDALSPPHPSPPPPLKMKSCQFQPRLQDFRFAK